MKILALEFSSPQRSVAIVQPAASPGPHAAPSVCEVIETGGRATKAIGMIEEALRDAQLEREQIDCVAVGLGPGSYTGIRAAIAFAQGWQLARNVKVLGISSVECIAEQVCADGLTGVINIVIDAQRNEFYLAQYTLHEPCNADIPVGERSAEFPVRSKLHGPGASQPLRLATLSEVQQIERAGQTLIGPEVTKWFAGGRIVFPRAAMLGQIALRRNVFVPGEKLEPIYLRETTFLKAPPPRILPH
jgi:tRNA threonylcarbamoyl adenosine modification protein YeaZ